MTIKPQLAIVLTLFVFVAGIFITSTLGLYSTTSTKTPAKMNIEQRFYLETHTVAQPQD